ncbi:MAG: bifunctional diaminohydroxyphosphoribosylaminopyrimidine deaminase/5-amino-6-(5-phosphoribosylamino)uracil reductase RibD [Thermodesulfobacteriota bacterium]|nr:bifunctional diaminohydroxyphosphoribosylaminopyrimidine deaminase/5-amino-6-(5-phosphoribosylamino)uracil reductase RibD [Thermodesulfobacteriota bacterium]
MLRDDDKRWMRRALRLAKKGRGRTSPNPMVGAVLVKDGRVVGEGYHVRAGEVHAEIIAMRKAGDEARGSTLYINLEPCSHYGKTPPCAPALIEAGVKKAVVGMEDPNPLVKGRGLEMLRAAGLDVEVGIFEEACQKLNEAFCKYIQTKEPFVILKIAATLDGKIATQHGESKWITGEDSRRLAHRLRDEADGLLVGIGTILKDDPLLTARIKGGRDPYRIILDSRLRIPEKAKIIDQNLEMTILATTELAPKEKMESLEKRGVRVLILDSVQGRVNLKSLLSRLGEMGMMSLLVEGGSEVNGSFLNEGLIDKIFLFLSPRLLGGQALGIFGGRGTEKLEGALSLNQLKIKKVGEDILLEGYPKKLCSLES